MSTVVANTLRSLAPSTSPPAVQRGDGTEVGWFARAWVNFNGTGTVAIRASQNVSSITDNGTGDYTVNFTNALADANYSVGGTAKFSRTTAGVNATTASPRSGFSDTASAARVYSFDMNSTLVDCEEVHIQVFR